MTYLRRLGQNRSFWTATITAIVAQSVFLLVLAASTGSGFEKVMVVYNPLWLLFEAVLTPFRPEAGPQPLLGLLALLCAVATYGLLAGALFDHLASRQQRAH